MDAKSNSARVANDTAIMCTSTVKDVHAQAELKNYVKHRPTVALTIFKRRKKQQPGDHIDFASIEESFFAVNSVSTF
jgi:hypothetical protein